MIEKPNFVTKGNTTLLRSKTKVLAFVRPSNNQYYYAFGKPSQSNYIGFFFPTKEECLNKLCEYYTLDSSILNNPMKEVK